MLHDASGLDSSTTRADLRAEPIQLSRIKIKTSTGHYPSLENKLGDILWGLVEMML